MELIYFSFPGNEALSRNLAQAEKAAEGQFDLHRFPDDESVIRILSEVRNKKVVLVCTLHQPKGLILDLYLFCKTAKSLGAAHITLIAPYLSYMRQDKIFKPGEGLTSHYFAEFLSTFIDSLITVDPHLHRISSLNDIYTIPTKVTHAAEAIAGWIKKNVPQALVIGPDSESEQWVSKVAKQAGAAYTVLKKVRHGDREVEVSVPHLENYPNHTPVLVDDIISTGRTLIETIGHLKKPGIKPVICIGIHAVFANNAYASLKEAGAADIITCNTIPHISNRIDISALLKPDV